MLESLSGILIPVAIVAGIIIVILGVWRKVPQDKAMVVTGLKKRVISGRGGIVIPLLEQSDRISLENIAVPLKTNESLDSNGVPINTDGVAVIKVKSDEKSVLIAVEQFNVSDMDKTISVIEKTVKDVLEGKLREIVSKMTIEQIYSNREEFANQVEQVAKVDIAKMGLEIVTFTIRDITDSNGYLKALGAKQIAEVKKNAAIAEAEAKREEMQRTSEAKRLGEEAQLKADTEIAAAKKEKELKVQEFKGEEKKAQAKADLAYEVEENIVRKQVIDATKNAELLEEQRQTEIAEQQAKKKEMELNATVKKVAEADRFGEEQKAEADKYAKIQEATAEAERVRILGEAEAAAIRAKGQATADAMKAEAEAMKEKAEAYKAYGDAAIVQMFVDKLPEIAKNVAEPLSKTDKMVIIDNGGEGGASKLTKNVTNIMAQVPEVVDSLTGINLVDLIKNFTNKSEGNSETASDSEDKVSKEDINKTLSNIVDKLNLLDDDDNEDKKDA